MSATPTYSVQSNIAIRLQSYYGGPGYPGTPPPLNADGTASVPWRTDFELVAGITEIPLSDIPTLQALLSADPAVITCPGLVVTVGGVSYSF
jgi:hypothetical protein